MALALLWAATGCGGGGTPPVQQSTAPPSPPVQQQQHHTTVTTYHNDNSRSGVNPNETTLTPGNVNVVSFGKIATVPVEGEVYAQPLYISDVRMPDGNNHNLVIVATQHDQVYAIDADTRTVLWQRSFLDQAGLVTPVPASDTNCDAVANEVGITGTPVIDTTADTIDLVVRTKETQGGQPFYYQRLHALRLTNGQDKVQPTVITSPSNDNGQFGSAQFDPLQNMQRSALLLANGQIYVAWASNCDLGGSGWFMSFDATTLEFTGAWTPTPSGILGGIWMGAAGPATDASGDIYVAIGNGWTDAPSGGDNYGSALVRLHPSGVTFTVADYFMPWDFSDLDNGDLDLGASGPVLLPAQPGAAHPNLLVVTGKDGTTYLLDRDNLGKWHPDHDSQILESFQNDTGEAFCTPAFWNNTLYCAVTQDSLKAYAFDPVTEQINPTPISASNPIRFGWPGATPAISADGRQDAIVWILQTDRYSMDNGYSVLRVFDATDLSHELYDTEMSLDRDHPGIAVKFTVPTVADGKVFVGTHNELDVYGLLSR